MIYYARRSRVIEPAVVVASLIGRLAKTPPLIDMDAHVVEPPTVWSSRLPAALRDQGPRIVHAPAGEVRLVDGRYIEQPSTDGPDVCWWAYEGTHLATVAGGGGTPVRAPEPGRDQQDRPGQRDPAARAQPAAGAAAPRR